MAKKIKPFSKEAQEAILALIEKEYGNDAVVMGNEFERMWRITSGSYELDYVLGGDEFQGWGWPMGRHNRAWGPTFGGKSLGLLNLYRGAQNIHTTTHRRLTLLAQFLQEQNKSSYADYVLEARDAFLKKFPEGMLCVHYDVEKQWNPELARKLGVDVKRMYIAKGTEIEEIGFKLKTMMGAWHIHGIDSASVGVTNARLNADSYQSLPMDKARAWGDVWSVAKEVFDPEYHTIFQIDQVRTKSRKMGQLTSFYEAPQGGKLAEHNCDLQVHFQPKTKLYYDSNGILVENYEKAEVDDVSGQKSPDGIESVILTEKIRVNKPYQVARVRVDNGNGAAYDLAFEIRKRAEHFGFLHKHGSWYYLVDENGEIHDKDHEDTIGWHGAAAAQKACLEDPRLKERVLHRWLGYGNEEAMKRVYESIELELKEREEENE